MGEGDEMAKITVSDVVEMADKAWAERVVGTPLFDEFVEASGALVSLVVDRGTDYAAAMAINATLSAALIGALRQSAEEDGFMKENLDVLTEASVELIRRALVKTCAH